MEYLHSITLIVLISHQTDTVITRYVAVQRSDARVSLDSIDLYHTIVCICMRKCASVEIPVKDLVYCQVVEPFPRKIRRALNLIH